MPRPGPRRPQVAIRLTQQGVEHIDQRATEAGVNRSEMIRRMLAYASAKMPRGMEAMTTLTKQARDTIKNRGDVTITGYTRHHYPDGTWHGDRCGCTDDRCIGFHHWDEGDCGCLPVLLDYYVEAQAK